MPSIQTATELGLAIRARRRELGWDQARLAREVGATRQWVIDIEKGKPRAELGLALRTLTVLGLGLFVEPRPTEDHARVMPSASMVTPRASYPSLDDIIERHRGPLGPLDEASRASRPYLAARPSAMSATTGRVSDAPSNDSAIDYLERIAAATIARRTTDHASDADASSTPQPAKSEIARRSNKAIASSRPDTVAATRDGKDLASTRPPRDNPRAAKPAKRAAPAKSRSRPR